MKRIAVPMLVLLALVSPGLAGCSKSGLSTASPAASPSVPATVPPTDAASDAASDAPSDPPTDDPSSDAPSASPGSDASPSLSASPVPFDTSTLPAAATELTGALPYLALPATIMVDPMDKLSDFDTPFWVGTGFHTVTGTTYQARLTKPGDADTLPNFIKEVGAAVIALGGTNVVTADSNAGSVAQDLPKATTQALGTGYGDLFNDPVSTWVIRTATKTVWVQASASTTEAGLLVTEQDPASAVVPARNPGGTPAATGATAPAPSPTAT